MSWTSFLDIADRRAALGCDPPHSVVRTPRANVAIADDSEEAAMVEERELLFERYLERLSGGAAHGIGRISRELPDFEALRAVEAVARARNIAGAARILGRRETEVLEYLRSLEAALGIVLLRRLAPEVTLTAEGTRLAQGIRAGLAEIVDALDALDPLRRPRFRSQG